jgi:hypothetical protein
MADIKAMGIAKKAMEKADANAAQLDEKANQSEYNKQQAQIDNLVLNSGGTSNLEVVQARTNTKGSTFPVISGRIQNIEKILGDGKTEFSFGEWEQGSLGGTGEPTTNDTRIRTKNTFVFSDEIIDVEINDGYKLFVGRYDSEGTYLSRLDAFYTESFQLVVEPSVSYKFILAKIDDSIIATSEYSNFTMSVYLNKLFEESYSGSQEFALEYGYLKNFSSQSLWDRKTVDVLQGEVPRTNRLLTKGFVDSNVSKIVAKNGYEFAIAVYDDNGVFVELLNNAEFFTEFNVVTKDFKNYRIIVRRSDNADFLRKEWINIGLFGFENKSVGQNNREFALSRGYLYYFDGSNLWEQGTITRTGSLNGDNRRLRTKSFLDKKITEVVAKDGYEITEIQYNQSGNFYHLNPIFKSRIVLNPQYQHRVVIRRTDQQDIAIEEAENVELFSFKNHDFDFQKVNDLDILSKNLYQSKGDLGLNVLDQRLEQRVNQYIVENGMNIDGVPKTRAEIKDYLLNRNNCFFRGKLRKNGKYLVDNNNKQVEIMGIGTHHLLQYKHLHTYENFKTLKYYGVNCIRMSAYLTDFTFVKSKMEMAIGYLNAKQETLDHMDSIIEKCIDLGLYVIVDFHCMQNEGGVTQYTQDAVEFFEHFASKYANVPNVLYELLNEPFDNTIESLSDFIAQTTNVIKTYVNDPVIILGKGASTVDEIYTWLTSNGYNDIFISFHSYVADPNTGDQAPRLEDYFLTKGYPIFVTEWGNADLSGDGELDDALAISYLNKLHDLGVPNVFWKFTNQDMTTSVLKYRDVAYWGYGGFIDNDLSHNGKLFFDKFTEFTWDNWIERNPVT